MNELAEWDSFYVIVGSAAGALIGLQFVVLTLIAQRTDNAPAEAGQAFSTPTVLHFCLVLFLAALLRAPWQTITPVAAAWAITGAAGVVYTVYVTMRIRSQSVYDPVLEDWIFYVALPLAANIALVMSGFTARSDMRMSLFAVAGAAVLMLFIGIHNAWDTTMWHVFSKPQHATDKEVEK
jgi:hypothetical protein